MAVFSNIPPHEWLLALVFLSGLSVLIILSEVLYKQFHVKKEALRKSIHVLSGLAVLLTPLFFDSGYPVVVIALFFATINLFAIFKKRLRSYNETSRASLGTFYYPLAAILLIIFFWEQKVHIFIISFALLAFGDALAGIVGTHFSSNKNLDLPWDQKSFIGALTMFVSSLLIILTGLIAFDTVFIYSFTLLCLIAVVIATISTVGELLAYRGSDNLSITVLSALALLVVEDTQEVNLFLTGALLAAAVAVIAYKFNALDLSGALAAFILGTWIFGIGGWLYSIPILFFFFISSALSHLPNTNNASSNEIIENGSRRNVKQVLANGLLPGICVSLTIWYDNSLVFFLYLVAVASATADTWATEIGLWKGKLPRSIISWRILPAGMSGGITLWGSFGAMLGSAAVSAIGLITLHWLQKYPFNFTYFFLIMLAGFSGQLIDSVLGATIQRKNRCCECQKITEKTKHCNQTTHFFSGIRWINNDLVNLLCVISGIVIFWIFIRYSNSF